jgi:putative hydrolase of the HAD superfamily
MIKAVLFDLDGTLLDRTNSLMAFLGQQHARFAARLGVVGLETWRSRFLALDQNGHVHKSVVYNVILAEFGGDPLADPELLEDYRERSCEHARGFPGMAQTLSTLRERGVKLGVVTNGETMFQMKNIKALGLEALVDAVVISEAEGVRKPDAAIFQLAAARLCVSSNECLFVGDNPSADILGGHAHSMVQCRGSLARHACAQSGR